MVLESRCGNLEEAKEVAWTSFPGYPPRSEKDCAEDSLEMRFLICGNR